MGTCAYKYIRFVEARRTCHRDKCSSPLPVPGLLTALQCNLSTSMCTIDERPQGQRSFHSRATFAESIRCSMNEARARGRVGICRSAEKGDQGMYFVFPGPQGRWSPEGEIRLATHPPMAAWGSLGLDRSVSDMVQRERGDSTVPTCCYRRRYNMRHRHWSRHTGKQEWQARLCKTGKCVMIFRGMR